MTRAAGRPAWRCAAIAIAIGVLPLAAPPEHVAADDGSYAAEVTADAPIAYWRLGEGSGAATAADSSGQGRDGIYTGGVELGAPGALSGSTDTAASFDGDTGRVTVPDDAAVRLDGDFSIEFWASQNTLANNKPGLLGTGTSGGAEGYLIYARADGRLTFKRNGTDTRTSAGALVTGQWHHYVITYDGTTVRWYVDGVPDSSAARTYPASVGSSPLLLGSGGRDGDNRLDEVALYPTALPASRIDAHFRAALPPESPAPYPDAVLADTPAAYWRLGEPAGATTAVDRSGHGRTGAYSGDVQMGLPGALEGTANSAVSFDGDTGRVTVPDDAAVRLNGDFSIEFWANQSTFMGSRPPVLGRGQPATADGYLVYARADGRLSFKRDGTEVLTTPGVLVSGEWHHYAITYDGTTSRWYVDGVPNTSAARTYASAGAGGPLHLGRVSQAGANRLDEVALYAHALPEGRIAAHVQAAAPYRSAVVADGALAYWRLGEAAGAATATDESGNGRAGTYSGAAQRGVPGALTATSDTAVSFDGGSGQVIVGDDAALRLNASFSIELWANQNSFANTWPGLVVKGPSHTPDGYLIYAQPAGRLSFKRNGVETVTTPGSLVTGEWHHFVVTYDGATLRWYVDGAADTTQAVRLPSGIGTAPLQIGQGDQAGDNQLDEVALYPSALSPAQIANHWGLGRAAGTAVPPAQPTGVKAVAGDASAGIRWTAPASDGGTNVTGYVVTVLPGGTTIDVPGWATSAQPSGLTNGTPYTFTVHAANAAGAGPASAPSAPITPSTPAPIAVRDATPGGWPAYTSELSGSGRNPAETTLTPANAGTVAEKWRWFADAALFGQPVVGAGGVFVADNNGFLHRLTLSGTPVWSTYVGYSDVSCSAQGAVSTPTLARLGSRPVLYLGGGDANLYAVDASSGDVIWRTALGDVENGAFAWSSPLLVGNALYMGYASLAACPMVPGAMLKVDPATGRVLTKTPVAPDGCLGGGIWGSPSYADGMIFVATGGPDRCPSPIPLLVAVVAFDATTLAVAGSWQIPEQEQVPINGDFASVPTVFDAPVPGTSGKLIAVVNKNGLFYAFDRMNVDAGPVWATRVAVAGSCPYCGFGGIAPAAYDGTRLYIAAGITTTAAGSPCKTAMRAINPVDGSIEWEDCRNGPLDSHTLGPASVANGVVLYSEGHFVNGVDAVSGTPLFSYQNALPDSWALMYAGTSIANGVIYAGGADGYLYALEPASG